MSGEFIGGLIGEGVNAVIGIGIYNVSVGVIVNNESKWGVRVYRYEGGDWHNAHGDDEFEIKPYDEKVQWEHNHESEWAEETRVPGNGWGVVGNVECTYHTDRSSDKLWNTVHFSIPGYPETSCMALWTLVYWEDRKLKVQAKLGFTGSFDDLNSENCPLKDVNLVNENVSLYISQGSGGPATADVSIYFKGDWFGKSDWS